MQTTYIDYRISVLKAAEAEATQDKNPKNLKENLGMIHYCIVACTELQQLKLDIQGRARDAKQ